MKLMIQNKVSKKAARNFMRQMVLQGYHAVEVERDSITDVHFKLDGETSIDYSVTFMPGSTFIGIRPK